MANITFTWRDRRRTMTSSAWVSDPGPGDPPSPVVILLHGLGGDINDMRNPVGYGLHYAHAGPAPATSPLGTFRYPGVGAAPVPPVVDGFLSVTGWEPFLNSNRFRTVNYSQIDPGRTLRRPVLELRALIRTLNARPDMESSRFILLCHSRGGVLARRFLRDNAGLPVLSRISKVITLHSPHQGSMVANDSATAGSALGAIVAAFVAPLPPAVSGPVAAAFAPLVAMLSGNAGRAQMRVGSPFLTSLAAGEAPPPGVAFHTFGGTSPTLTRLWGWAYTLGSALPAPPPAPPLFTHVATPVQIPGVSPVLDSLPNVEPEITPGAGDMLVADARSHLPFSTTRTTNALNHIEALYDPTLQSQVITLLGEGTWGAWTRHPGQFSGTPRLVADENSRLTLYVSEQYRLRIRRELAAGDVVPIGTLAPALGEAVGWSNWVRVDRDGDSDVAAAFDNAIVNGTTVPGRLHLFWLGEPTYDPTEDDPAYGYGGIPRPTLRNLTAIWRQTNPDDWSSVRDLGGTTWQESDLIDGLIIPDFTLKSGVAAVRPAAGPLEVFSVGKGDKLYRIRQVPATPPAWPTWSDPEPLGFPAAGCPAAVADALGRTHLFFRAPDGSMQHRRRSGNDPWLSMPFPSAPPMAGDPVVVFRGNGSMLVFARGTDARVWRSRQMGINWTPWVALPGEVFGDPAAARNGNGRVEVFARARANSRVLRLTEPVFVNDPWPQWTELEGGEADSSPAVGLRADNLLVLFVVASDGTLRQRLQIAPGVW